MISKNSMYIMDNEQYDYQFLSFVLCHNNIKTKICNGLPYRTPQNLVFVFQEIMLKIRTTSKLYCKFKILRLPKQFLKYPTNKPRKH